MPIWFELVFIAVMSYLLGLGLGWMIWGRAPDVDALPEEDED